MATLNGANKDLTPGQKVSFTGTGIVQPDGSIKVISIKMGKRGKMSTQEVLLQNIERRIDELKAVTPKSETRL